VVDRLHMFKYTHAVVRKVPVRTLAGCLHLEEPDFPIDPELSAVQHENYTATVKRLVSHVIELDEDEVHPDCCFVEDTAIIIGDTAVICCMGAVSRRGEEIPVRRALEKLHNMKIISIEHPGMIDGGDVLFTGTELLVGLSSRTNLFAFEQLVQIFAEKLAVIHLTVTAGLHLKSVISAFDSRTLVISDCSIGSSVRVEIMRVLPDRYNFCCVPDSVCSNIVRIHDQLLIQAGYPYSENILRDLCILHNVEVICLHMSELIKADGALTCCSLLFNPSQ
jgi:dimethylargininase